MQPSSKFPCKLACFLETAFAPMNMRPLFLLTASCASAQLYGDWTLAGQMSCATTQTETLPADAYLVLYVAAGAELIENRRGRGTPRPTRRRRSRRRRPRSAPPGGG